MRKTVDESIKEAIAELEKITADPATRELYYQREKDLRDYISALDYERKKALKEGHEQGFEQGREEGLEQGLEQGIEKGRAERDKEMIKAMHDSGIEIDVICKVANLSKEEVEKILKLKS